MSKILVIEDHLQMRRNLVTILEMEGYEVASAENGLQGIELARTQQPDLVLCDVMMPEMDGLGFIEALRIDPLTATIPVIFVTAKGDKSDVRAGMNKGADDYLVKPVARDELLSAVQVRLDRRKTHLAEQSSRATGGTFNPDFSSPQPLLVLGLTPREAEVLLWVAQGKSNADVSILLGMAEKTAKKHITSIFEKLGVEGRNAATLRALEILSGPSERLTGR